MQSARSSARRKSCGIYFRSDNCHRIFAAKPFIHATAINALQIPPESHPLNISSAIVYARSEREPALREQLLQVPGVEVHAATEDGKVIVTIEAENDRAAIDTYEAIGRIDGVLNVAMIFQQTESHPDQELEQCK
jgi:nitrate reductase NapD